MGLVWKDPKRFLIWTMFRGSSGHLKFDKNRWWNRPRWIDIFIIYQLTHNVIFQSWGQQHGSGHDCAQKWTWSLSLTWRLRFRQVGFLFLQNVTTVAEGEGGKVTQWGESLGSEDGWGGRGRSGYYFKVRGLLWETEKASRSVEEWELKLNDKITGQPGGSLGDEVIVVMMCKTRAEAYDVT